MTQPEVSSPEEQSILDGIDVWVEREVRPIAMKFDLADEYPHDLVESMKEMGLFGATISQEHGGLGLSAWQYAQIIMKISSVWMAPTGILNSHLIMAHAIERAGTDEQKRHYLPMMATGEYRGSLALTEPNAGSDLQAIRTKAVHDGDAYVVNGTKTWITNSYFGSGTLLLVKTDTEADPRYKGMTMLLADKGPGFEVTSKFKKLGYRAIDTCEVVFNDYRVPDDRVLGGTEGSGFFQAAGGLELGRINVAARGAGLAEGALARALRYSQERHTFGKPICEHQAIQLKLAEMTSQVEAARCLIKNAAIKHDTGARCDLESSIAKYFASEAGLFCSQEAMRIFGGYSFSVEYEIERYYRDAMLMCIGEGTNEILKTVIAKQLVSRNTI